MPLISPMMPVPLSEHIYPYYTARQPVQSLYLKAEWPIMELVDHKSVEGPVSGYCIGRNYLLLASMAWALYSS